MNFHLYSLIILILFITWTETYPIRQWVRRIKKEVDEAFSVRPEYKVGSKLVIQRA